MSARAGVTGDSMEPHDKYPGMDWEDVLLVAKQRIRLARAGVFYMIQPGAAPDIEQGDFGYAIDDALGQALDAIAEAERRVYRRRRGGSDS